MIKCSVDNELLTAALEAFKMFHSPEEYENNKHVKLITMRQQFLPYDNLLKMQFPGEIHVEEPSIANISESQLEKPRFELYAALPVVDCDVPLCVDYSNGNAYLWDGI